MGFYPEKFEEAVKKYEEGKSISDIAKIYNVSYKTVYHQFVKEKIHKRVKKIDFSLEEKNEIEYLRKKGYGPYRIGDIMKKNPIRVKEYISEVLPNTKTTLTHYDRSSSNRVSYQLNEHFFRNINIEEKAYWLGFLYADGSLSQNRLTINLAEEDATHLDKFIKSIEFTGNYKIKVEDTNFKKESKKANLEVNSTLMIKDLSKFVPVGKKSDKITFPFEISKQLYKHFIRGYFDGDGYVIKTRKHIGFCGNLVFINQLRDIFETNDFATNKDGTIGNQTETYGELKYSKKVTRKIMDWMYKGATVYLDRKFNEYYN